MSVAQVLHNANQEQVFEACARDIVSQVLRGYNGTILTYGETGAGNVHVHVCAYAYMYMYVGVLWAKKAVVTSGGWGTFRGTYMYNYTRTRSCTLDEKKRVLDLHVHVRT